MPRLLPFDRILVRVRVLVLVLVLILILFNSPCPDAPFTRTD